MLFRITRRIASVHKELRINIFPQSTPYQDKLEREILAKIEDLAGQEFYRPRLEEIKKYLDCYSPQLPPVRVVIGGTNGKGQVATQLAAHLHWQGISYSLFTSPHILSVTERLSYDGKNISYHQLGERLDRVLGRLGTACPLSFYELLFAIFLEGHLYHPHPVEVMISEVGLGGRFDAVNAVEPTLSAIVSIGHDHTEILGEDLEQILGEKLGVARPGVPLLTTITQGPLRHFCADYCRRQEIPHQDLLQGPVGRQLVQASYFQRNSALAAQLAQEIIGGLPPEVNEAVGLGRWQTVGDFTFVSAHNTDGLAALLSDQRMKKFKAVIFSLSEREDKFIQQMLETLAQFELPLYFSTRPHYKKLCERKWPGLGVGRPINSFYPKDIQGPFLVTGSNYFIGEFQKAMLSC